MAVGVGVNPLYCAYACTVCVHVSGMFYMYVHTCMRVHSCGNFAASSFSLSFSVSVEALAFAVIRSSFSA